MKVNLLAVVLVCGSAVGSSWQPTGNRPVPGPVPVPAGPGNRLPGEVARAAPVPEDLSAKIDINFPGGTVGEFATILRAGSSESLNLIVSPSVESLPLPAISLRKANVLAALKAMASSLDNQVEIDYIGAEAEGFAPIVSVLANRRMSPPQPAASANLVVIPITERVGPRAEALSAIENGLTMLGSGNPPSVKFHEPSGLLFVMGTNAQIVAAKSVLEALEQRAGSEASKSMTRLGQQMMSKFKLSSPTDVTDKIVELEKRAARTDELQVELATLKATSAAELKIAARDAEVKTAMERDRLADAQKAMTDAAAQIAVQRTEAATSAAMVDSLRKQLAQAEDEARSLREARHIMDDEMRKLRQVIDKLEAELARAQQDAAARAVK